MTDNQRTPDTLNIVEYGNNCIPVLPIISLENTQNRPNHRGLEAPAQVAMEQMLSNKAVTLLHELDLGQHILFIMNDGSIDLLANGEHTSSLAGNGLHLDRDETYRLFVSLHEYFQQEMWCSLDALEAEQPQAERRCTLTEAVRCIHITREQIC